MVLAERQRRTTRLYICLTAACGNSWAFLGALCFSYIVEFLPLLKYAYSLKPICGAKLVTAYIL